jgi:hypothetical protein
MELGGNGKTFVLMLHNDNRDSHCTLRVFTLFMIDLVVLEMVSLALRKEGIFTTYMYSYYTQNLFSSALRLNNVMSLYASPSLRQRVYSKMHTGHFVIDPMRTPYEFLEACSFSYFAINSFCN